MATPTLRAWHAHSWPMLVALVLCAIGFLVPAARERSRRLADPRIVAELAENDGLHYLDIAGEFAAGEFGMRYVLSRPHRQPLYPAALALGGALVGRQPAQLTLVNLAIGALAVMAAGLAAWWAFASRLAGLAAGALLAASPFLREASQLLLTEPLFVLVVTGALACLLRASRDERPRLAMAAGAAFGLAYLTRPNGLMLFAAAQCVLVLDLLLRWRTRRDRPSLRRLAVLPLGTTLAFLVVATPSWLPRLVHKGQPFYHGYLSNFLWVDRYEDASVAGDPRYTFADYARNHSWSDAWHRMADGWHTVAFDVPFHELGALTTWLSAAGLAAALLMRRRELLLMTLLFVLQMTPIAWTFPANPTTRIPAAATLPFGVFYVAFVASLVGRRATALTSRSRPESAPAH